MRKIIFTLSIIFIAFILVSCVMEQSTKYKVEFIVEDEVYDICYVESLSKVEKPDNPTMEGYEFIGWYHGDLKFDFDTEIITNITLVARFKLIPNEVEIYYDVVFMLDNEVYYETKVLEGSNVEKPTDPSKEDAVFLGWFLDNSFNEEFDFDTKIYSNIVLISKFEVVETSFNAICVAYEEGIWIEWDYIKECMVQYKQSSDSDWINVDEELIRYYNDYTRVDIVGLPEGYYDVKVILNSGETFKKNNLFVSQIDRSGYAFFNNPEGVGAYNLDGSLKEDTIVLYVNDENKNTIECMGYVGLVEIIKNQSKINRPLLIRVIGSITTNQFKPKSNAPRLADNSNLQLDSFWNNELETKYKENLAGLTIKYTDRYLKKSVTYLSTKAGYEFSKEQSTSTSTTTYNGSQYTNIKGKKVYDDDSYWNMLDVTYASNITLEGIGIDAEFVQFGFNWKNCNSIEVKNITFTNYPEDACSFEGNPDNVSEYGRYFIHNNRFNAGLNNWDVTGERDKPSGDGAIDIRTIRGITVSYNEFYKCKKTGLVGGSDSVLTMDVTFHHNYYNEVGSRLPLGRQANMHIYNNYYYNCSTCQDIRANAFVLSEANYFEKCSNPQKVTTSNDYKNTVIKSYNDYFTGCGSSKATIVSSRTKTLNGKCKPDGISDYNNFDINKAIFYYDDINQVSKVYRLTDANTAKEDVLRLAGVLKK